MSAPRKLLLAMTVTEAERMRDAFGLSPDEWRCVGFYDALVGAQFDRIVAVLPNHLDDVRIKSRVQHLTTRLAVDGELIFL